MSVTDSERAYIPAAGHHWRLPFYDPITKLIGADRARKPLIDQAGLRAGHSVLEIGCGTGSLVVQIARDYPGVQVAGLDPDPKALARASRKAQRAGTTIRFDRGFSDALPYDDASFDRVFSSFMLHHLSRVDKQKTLAEVRRVLTPGGRLELLDFQGPDVKPGGLMRRLHSHELFEDNAQSRVLALLTAAGLTDARRVGERRLLIGGVAYYQASRPM